MYKNMNKEELLQLHNKKLTEREYFLDLIENTNIINHSDVCDCMEYRVKSIEVDNYEISIKVIK